MKKNDKSIKPVLINNVNVNNDELDEIQYRFTQNKKFIDKMKHKLKYFEDITP
jgi:hypothetical protein